MPTPQIYPWGPFQPLGLITVTTAGVPVQLDANLGAAGGYYSATGKSEFTFQWQQVWLAASTSNNGNIYLVTPGQPATNTSAIIWKLGPGATLFLGAGYQTRNGFDLNSFWLDADTSGNTVQVTALPGV